MQGRNGVDQFSQFLNIVIIVLFVISLFIKWTPIYWLAIVLLIYMYKVLFYAKHADADNVIVLL